MEMKDARPYSVWNLAYTKRYYLRHPLTFCRHIWQNLRAAYYRAKYGWCPGDVWEFGYWFLEIAPQMLRYLAENGCGYPGTDDFPTPESWHDHLISISNLLENARDEVRDKKNEYAAAYNEEIDNQRWINKNDDGSVVVKRSDSPTFNNYYNRDLELLREQDIMIEEAFKLLAETPFKGIWD